MTSHVVVIEDDVDLAEMAAQRLRRAMGAEVRTFLQGLPALAYLKDGRPIDLVCVDLSLPDINGFQICSTLRSDPSTSHVPILVISGRTGLDDYARAHELGVNAYLGKPFAMRTLVDVAQRLLARGRS